METPNTETDLAGFIASATGPLCVSGGGTRRVGGLCDGDSVSTRGLHGVSLYEPGALTLVAQAGTPLAVIEAQLASEGQRLAFEPMDHRALLGTDGTPTIGGVVAGNVSGPRRIQTGACRDHLLGVRFVDGRGTVLKNGGRVMKNVTGYDLVKLMAGSWGTLGVLTEVSLKVLPKPETSSTLVLNGLDVGQAVKALSQALGSPFEVTGAAHLPDAGEGQTLIRLEGFADSVSYRVKKLGDDLASFGPAQVIEADAQVWQSVRDVLPFADQAGDVWRMSMRPSDAPELCRSIQHAWPDARFVLDWGGGLVWALVPPGSNLRAHAMRGHMTLIRASDETRAQLGVFHPEPKALADLSEGLRRQFDPKGILNRGLMGQGDHADQLH